MATSTLCTVCSAIDFKALFYEDVYSRTQWSKEPIPLSKDSVRLGSLQAVVEQAAQCAFCRLVSDPRVQARRADYEGLDAEAADWQVYITARASLRVSLGFRHSYAPSSAKVYALLALPGDDRPIVEASVKPFLDSAEYLIEPLNNPDGTEGRLIPPSPDFTELRYWLNNCKFGHAICATRAGHDLERFRGQFLLEKILPFTRRWLDPVPPGSPLFKLIDIGSRRIVSATHDLSYATLSYVWGNVQSTPDYMLKKHKLDWKIAGSTRYVSLPETLPATIEDAMAVAEGLRIKYLWVDSLCIVQDDEEEKRLQIQDMDNIYGNAALCIVAANGTSPADGLAGVSRERDDLQKAVTCNGVKMGYTTPDLMPILRDSKWKSRAWTFQEMMLSRRALIFTAGEIFFQCTLNEQREAVSSMKEHISSEKDRGDDGYQAFKTWKRLSYRQRRDKDTELNFEIYADCVKEYTSREMSVRSDVLNAFNGLSIRLEAFLKSRMYFGLVADYSFVESLLWIPVGPLYARRMEQYNPSITPGFMFPSWSWAGWQGPVQNDDAPYIEDARHPGDGVTEKVLKNIDFTDRGYLGDPQGAEPFIDAEGLPAGILPYSTPLAVLSLKDAPLKLTLEYGKPGGQTPRIMTIVDSGGNTVGGCIMSSEYQFESRGFFILLGSLQLQQNFFFDFQWERSRKGKVVKYNYVMLVESINRIFYRVGLGQVTEQAWNEADPVECDLLLG